MSLRELPGALVEMWEEIMQEFASKLNKECAEEVGGSNSNKRRYLEHM